MRDHMRGSAASQSFKTVALYKARGRRFDRDVATRHSIQEQRARADARAAEHAVLMAQRVLKSRERITDLLQEQLQTLPPDQVQLFREAAETASTREMAMADHADDAWLRARLANDRHKDVLAIRPARHVCHADALEQLDEAVAQQRRAMDATLTTGMAKMAYEIML